MGRQAIIRLVVMAVAVPLAAKALRRFGESMQVRQGGESRMGDTLKKAASGLEVVAGRR